MPKITLDNFAALFGTSIDDFDNECRQFINNTDFGYTKLNKQERDATILKILKRIDSGELTQAGQKSKPRWQKGWDENLQNFISKGYDLSELIPKYVHPDQTLRLHREYIKSHEANFELNYFTVLRLWLFKKYLNNFDEIYEFACGPGYNLPVLSRLFPDKVLHGLDWVEPSVKIVNLLKEKHGIKVTGHLFDFFSPDYNLKIADNGVALSIGGLEQMGKDHFHFVQFLIQKSFKLCIHVEPISELYEENNLLDYLALTFHKKRNYLDGFLTYLKKLENENKIKILKIQRSYFGSLYHDGWSIVIWEPVT